MKIFNHEMKWWELLLGVVVWPILIAVVLAQAGVISWFTYEGLKEIGFWPIAFVAAAFGIGYWAHWWHSLSPEERAARRIESRRYDDEH